MTLIVTLAGCLQPGPGVTLEAVNTGDVAVHGEVRVLTSSDEPATPFDVPGHATTRVGLRPPATFGLNVTLSAPSGAVARLSETINRSACAHDLLYRFVLHGSADGVSVGTGVVVCA